MRALYLSSLAVIDVTLLVWIYNKSGATKKKLNRNLERRYIIEPRESLTLSNPYQETINFCDREKRRYVVFVLL